MDDEFEGGRGERQVSERWRIFATQIVACVVAAILLVLLATFGARYLPIG